MRPLRLPLRSSTLAIQLVMLGLAAAAAPLTGCDDAGTSTDLGMADMSVFSPDLAEPGDGGSTSDGSSDGSVPGAIIVAERVFTPSGRLYYVSALSSMPTTAIDRSKALELTSADVEIYSGKVFIRDRTSNVMTRYSVDANLKLVPEGQLSFQNTGLPTTRAYTAYVSPTLAWILDGAGLRMIGWNPTDMKLTGDIVALDFLKKNNLPDISLGVPTRVGDRLVVPVSWDDFDNLLTNPGIGAALILDANPKVAPTVVEDSRVGGGYVAWDFGGDAFVGGTVGGDVVLFGGVPGGGKAPPSGIVRIKAGATTFDPGYVVDLTAATKSIGVWGVHMLDSTHVLCQILDPAVDTTKFMTPDDYYNSEDFYYVLFDGTTGKVTKQTAIPTGGIGNSQEHVVDGTLYVQVTGANGAEVYPATAATGIGPKAFDVPSGDLWFAHRLR